MILSKRVRYRLRDSLSDEIKKEYPLLFDGKWRQGNLHKEDDALFVEIKSPDYYGFVSIKDVELQSEEDKDFEEKAYVLRGSPEREW